MIAGVGIDIVSISRIEKSIKNPNFIKRVLTEKEAIYLSEKANISQTAAGIFAAKEAFSKSIGTGIKGFKLTDVEIAHNKEGQPFIVLLNGLCNTLCSFSFHLSISHDKEIATAIVIAEKSGT